MTSNRALSVQDWQQQQLNERAHNEPLLLWTRSLSRPVKDRLAFLHSAFAGALAAALKTGRPPLQPGKTRQPCAQLHAKVTRALADQLQAAALRTEKLPARCVTCAEPDECRLAWSLPA